MTLELLVFFLGWFFQAFTGFGAGIFIVGILSLVYDPKEVVVSSALVNLVGTLTMALLLLRRSAPDFRNLTFLIGGSVPGIYLGSFTLVEIERSLLMKLIGLFIFSLGLYDLLVQRGTLKKVALKDSPRLAVIFGFIGGFFAGLVGMGGPPPVVYLNQVIKDVGKFKTTLTLFFTSNILFRILFYEVEGGSEFLDPSMFLSALLSVPPAIALGLVLSSKVPTSGFKKIVSLSVLVLGLLVTWEALQVEQSPQ